MMLKGGFPEEINTFLATNLLIALPKTIDDISRPIGIGTMLRKVASKFVERAARQKLGQNYFKSFQLALKRGGMEELIHALNLDLSKDCSLDLASLDAANAFNSANKNIALIQILKHFPKGFRLINSMYFHQSNQFLHQ